MLSWSRRRRLLPRGWISPLRDVPAERESSGRVRYLSAPERERLLAVCRISRWRKLHLLVLMAIVTGARKGELLGLHFRDLDLEAGTATLERTKNGDKRVLVLTPTVIAEIKRHGVGAPDALLFASRINPTRPHTIDTAWAYALKTANIEDCHFHDLRHTHASYLAQSGASLLEIADSLGHRSLAMTRRYSHLTIDHKRKLVERVLGGIG